MSDEQEETRNRGEDEEYNEEEDEDFDPENAQNDDGFSGDDEDEEDQPSKKKQKKKASGGNDADFDVETEKEVKKANYSKIESAEGGLIKTRHQRAVEEQSYSKSFRSIMNQKGSADIDDAWKKLQEQAKEKLKIKFSAQAVATSLEEESQFVASEKIKIKRKYEYAGETITEEKWVDRESAEGKAYLNSLSAKEKVESSNTKEAEKKEDDLNIKSGFNERGEKLRIVRKRPPLLEGIINGSIKPKFNTLEKSRVDFAHLVDQEGINDELVQHSKDGYLEKQDFLSRVQFHRETQVKEIRRKELQSKPK